MYRLKPLVLLLLAFFIVPLIAYAELPFKSEVNISYSFDDSGVEGSTLIDEVGNGSNDGDIKAGVSTGTAFPPGEALTGDGTTTSNGVEINDTPIIRKIINSLNFAMYICFKTTDTDLFGLFSNIDNVDGPITVRVNNPNANKIGLTFRTGDFPISTSTSVTDGHPWQMLWQVNGSRHELWLNGTREADDFLRNIDTTQPPEDFYFFVHQASRTVGNVDITQFMIFNNNMTQDKIESLAEGDCKTFDDLQDEAPPPILPVINASFNVSVNNLRAGVVLNMSYNMSDGTALLFGNITVNSSGAEIISLANFSLSGTKGEMYNVTTFSEVGVFNVTGFVTNSENVVAQNSTILNIRTTNLQIRADNNLTTEVSNPGQADFAAFDTNDFSVVFTSNKSSSSGAGNVFWSLAYLTLTTNSFQVKAEDDTGANQAGQANWMAVVSDDYALDTGKFECGTTPMISGNPSISTVTFNTPFPDTNYATFCSPADDTDTPACNPTKDNKGTSSIVLEIRDDTGAVEAVTGANWCVITYGNHTVDGVEIKAGSSTTAADGTFNVGIGTEDQMPNTDYVVITGLQVDQNTGLDCQCDIETKTTSGFTGTCYIDAATSSECGPEPLNWIMLEKINRDLSFVVSDLQPCEYSGSGDFIIDASENCAVTEDAILAGNKFIVHSSGTIDLQAKILGAVETIINSGAHITCRESGGCFGG